MTEVKTVQIPIINQNICIGCGSCETICPEIFHLGQEGKSQVLKESGDCDLQFVIDSCPVTAISAIEK